MIDKTWYLDNVQNIAKENPYSFYVPSDELLNQIDVGHTVQLMFINDAIGDDVDYDGERMWVKITKIAGDDFGGVLVNDPIVIRDLHNGDSVQFNSWHIMTVYDLKDPVPSLADDYWDRCFTTRAILYDNAPIGYLYRGEPIEYDNADEKNYKDSGWQILSGDESNEYMDDPDNCVVIALAKVLNIDDSFIHLLSADIGSVFVKNSKGEWVQEELADDE